MTVSRDLVNVVEVALEGESFELHSDGDQLTAIMAGDQTSGFIPTCYRLKTTTATRFEMLIDITAVDFPQRAKRFEVVYHLLSVSHNERMRLKIHTDGKSPIPSVVSVWPAANWFEREVWDMFGIFFSDHPDMRRLLTDYGFSGHPLRKDFPLSGYTQVRYDTEQGRVIQEPTNLTQGFRQFEFESPWQIDAGANTGDEKAS